METKNLVEMALLLLVYMVYRAPRGLFIVDLPPEGDELVLAQFLVGRGLVTVIPHDTKLVVQINLPGLSSAVQLAAGLEDC